MLDLLRNTPMITPTVTAKSMKMNKNGNKFMKGKRLIS